MFAGTGDAVLLPLLPTYKFVTKPCYNFKHFLTLLAAVCVTVKIAKVA